MLLRTKLLILFTAISIIPLALVSSTGYTNFKNLLAENAIKNVDNIASLQESRIEAINKSNQEKLELLSSNNNLKASLAEHNSGSETAREQILYTILNLIKNYPSFDRIDVVGTNGNIIESTQLGFAGSDYKESHLFKEGLIKTTYNTIAKDEEGRLKLFMSSPIKVNDQTIGVLIVVAKSNEIIALSNDYTGLGNSGETILVARDQDGKIIYITPLRNNPFVSLQQVPFEGGYNQPIERAMSRQEGPLANVKSYSGDPVFASTRYIDSTGWGLVTQINTSEVFTNAERLKSLFLFFVLTSSIFVGLVSLAVSKSLSMPLNKLKSAADKIAGGDLNTKILSETKDEVGFLANTFNKMAEALHESYTNLENKVQERTKTLVQRQKELETEKAKDEAILHSIGEGLIAYDNSGKITLMNHLAEQIIGSKFDDIKDKIHWDLWDLEDKKGNVIKTEDRPFAVALKEHRVVSDKSHYFRKKNSTKDRFPISYTVAPIHIGGEMLGVIEVFSDITAEKELEMLKDEFISIVSHELRTPMTAIKGLVSMILEGDFGDVNPNIKEPLSNVSFSSERLIHLVNDMLDASSIDAGKLKLKIEDINLKKIVEEVSNSLSSIAKQKGLFINSDQVESLWAQSDQEKIREVLNNLIGNSLKFTDKGGITLLTQRDGDLIKLLIQDTGIGISAENQQKLFNKFQQVGVELNNHKQGTGLGLYITRELVRKMGGDLWIEKSEIGSGSTFAFSLPASGTDLANNVKSKVQKDNPS